MAEPSDVRPPVDLPCRRSEQQPCASYLAVAVAVPLPRPMARASRRRTPGRLSGFTGIALAGEGRERAKERRNGKRRVHKLRTSPVGNALRLSRAQGASWLMEEAASRGGLG